MSKEVKPLVVDETLQVKKYTSKEGVVRYIKDGKLHNWDGPAVIHPDGKEEYFINGFEHTKDSWKKARKSGDGLPWYKSSVAKARF